MIVLVLNCGSSSVKHALFELPADPPGSAHRTLARGLVERIGDAPDAYEIAVRQVLRDTHDVLAGRTLDAVGHRVVHGGSELTEPAVIDEALLAAIDASAAIAPLHNPPAAASIRACLAQLPDVPQVAAFDTAFHARMPRRAVTYAIDVEVAERHDIRRYGFHGLSHEYVSGIAADFLETPLDQLRLITLHLGNGASACAVEYGRSTETSMGATPLEGLVMGTRAGDVDAGALLALMRAGYDADRLDELLNRRSGLAGLSGLSSDLREIEAAAATGDDRARMAINVFAHRARKYIGSYAAAMGGVDAIVFTGGIGENSASMRARILQRLEFLGVQLDLDRNRDGLVRRDGEFARITSDRSRVEALVVKSNEELMIALHARTLLAALGERDAPSLQIPIAISGRHCHLTRATFARLFGEGVEPTPARSLSQPGQFACEQRVDLIGPRERIDGVRVLGPLRDVDQVEISRTDEFRLGVDAPVRDSGKVAGSAAITLQGPCGTVELAEGLICARRHIHMHPDDATRFGVADRDEVAVTIVGGPRDLVFGDVLIRVKDTYALEMHLDTDEANAAELGGAASGRLLHGDVDGDGDGQQVRVDNAHGCIEERPGARGQDASTAARQSAARTS